MASFNVSRGDQGLANAQQLGRCLRQDFWLHRAQAPALLQKALAVPSEEAEVTQL